MGPPDRLSFNWWAGFGFAVSVHNFPYKYGVSVLIGCLWVHVGLGPDYVTAGNAENGSAGGNS